MGDRCGNSRSKDARHYINLLAPFSLHVMIFCAQIYLNQVYNLGMFFLGGGAFPTFHRDRSIRLGGQGNASRSPLEV
jgi:hypothetical protein